MHAGTVDLNYSRYSLGNKSYTMTVKRVISVIVVSACMGFVVQNSFSQSPSPKIYLDYTKAVLDSAYTQGYWAPNVKAVNQQLKALNSHTQLSIGKPERIQYGTTAVEQLDLYAARRKNAPVHIFIHGGA